MTLRMSLVGIGDRLQSRSTRLGWYLRGRGLGFRRGATEWQGIFGVVGAPRRHAHAQMSTADIEHRARRHADVAALLDGWGLSPRPAQLWRFVDAADDACDGARGFLTLIGLLPSRIDAGDEREIQRANLSLALLGEIGTAFDRVTPRVAAVLEHRLRRRDYSSLRAMADAVRVFEEVTQLGRRWPKATRIGVLDAFLGDIGAGLANPLLIRARDADLARQTADRLRDQMVAFDAAMRAAWHVQYYLALRWPSHWGVGEARTRSTAIARAESLERSLRRERQLRPRDVDNLTQRLVDAIGKLERLMERINGPNGAKTPPQSAPLREPGRSDVEHALAFFGYQPGVRPDRTALRKRFRQLAQTMHPDRADPDAASQKAAHARFLTLNQHYHLLKLSV